MLDTVVISCGDVCSNVAFDTLVGVPVFSVFFLGRFFIRNRQNYIQKMRMEDKMNTVIAREKKKIREQDGSTLVYIYIYIYIHTPIHTHTHI